MVIIIVKMLTPEPDIQNINIVYIIDPDGDLARAHAFASKTST